MKGDKGRVMRTRRRGKGSRARMAVSLRATRQERAPLCPHHARVIQPRTHVSLHSIARAVQTHTSHSERGVQRHALRVLHEHREACPHTADTHTDNESMTDLTFGLGRDTDTA